MDLVRGSMLLAGDGFLNTGRDGCLDSFGSIGRLHDLSSVIGIVGNARKDLHGFLGYEAVIGHICSASARK